MEADVSYPSLLRSVASLLSRVGVKGGYLYSSFDFDDASDVIDGNNGWMAGLFFGGNRPGRVGVMGEFNIQAKRGEADTDGIFMVS